MIWWIIGLVVLSPFIVWFTFAFVTIWWGAWIELKNMLLDCWGYHK